MGTCVRDCVRRCSQIHSDDEYASDFSVPIFEQLCCNGVTLHETLEQIRPHQLERQAKTRKEIARATRAIRTSTRARIVAELDIGRKTAGDQVEEPATIPPVTTATHRQARTTRKAKAKANKWIVGTNQWSESASTVSYPSQTPSPNGALSCNPDVEQIDTDMTEDDW